MKNIVFITVTAALLMFVTSCGQGQQKSANAPQQEEADIKVDVRTWPRMPVDEFGCMLEKTFGYRDERFNCSLTDYVNTGDPCNNTEEYYEGPSFPESLVKKVHPWMEQIILSWEGGMLQHAWFIFENKPTEEEILTEFGIDLENIPENIDRINAENGQLVLEGFMHMGAGDIDCDEYLREMFGESNPVPPPPAIIVGTWKAPAKANHVAYLEIFPDGMAGLYLGSSEDDELYEIYKGTVFAEEENENEIVLKMDLNLEWYIYESEDGSPIQGVPNSYNGTYTIRHILEGDNQSLNVKANEDADPLFTKKELKMELVLKTLQGSSMADPESESD